MTIPTFRRPAAAAAAGDAIPFEHDGVMHLFYLSSPTGTVDYPDRVRTTWQHAISRDLINWEELVPAVEPGTPGAYDGGGIWTGSVVEHDGTFYLFYTGHHVGVDNPQTICLATSQDLITFNKHEANPLVLPTSTFESVDWRDPYVFWNEEEGIWWMLIAARLAEGPYWRRGCIVLATSTDLLEWTVEDEPLYSPGTTYCPECPEMWADAEGRWHLVYSRFSEEVGTVSRVAASPRGPFREPERPDFGGRRWYAAKSAPWRGERAFFGWIHDQVTDDRGHRWQWGGDFALPRLISPRPDGTLDVRPVTSPAEKPESDKVALDGAGGSADHSFTTVLPTRADLALSFTSITPDTRALGVALISDERGGGWRLELLPATGEVRLRREPTPMDDFWADLTGRAAEYREVDGEFVGHSRILGSVTNVTIRVVLDGPLFEAYVNDQVALTHRLDADTQYVLNAFVVDGSTAATVSVSALA